MSTSKPPSNTKSVNRHHYRNDVIKIWTDKFIPSRLSQIWQAEPERNTSLPYQGSVWRSEIFV
ncbi:hypothetical protein, partial [Salmonella enterica]|uniref:hypothetical protein n=1 Tax=Salmonella enterica TaxID=28901 RepID=UPI001E5F7479